MSEYTEYLREVLSDFGPVTARRMFGGHGIFHAGLMFALVADDVLYLKADDENRPDFEAAGLPAFGYEKRGKRVQLSYFQAPDDMLDDPEVAVHWARRAFAAARRARR
ncbi:TfoX-like protein [Isoalcanivorax pacificus W11-5]|uniref:TfoX-like protein n=1 Tax=Isoalcanivorax pacificus W11-5 TaxID=391936 RepID=A0A0B4XTW1_9GAMM|nr:TfoX/Sxy family protein [Isoalcanivorax pacificus]AJD49923.1 TfoX-like protein [Isoalcanivorax pacificus W11-5]